MRIAKNVQFGWKQRKNDTPVKWQLFSKVFKFIFGALIPIFSGTPLFASHTSDIITFCLGVGIVILSGLDMLLGVDPNAVQGNVDSAPDETDEGYGPGIPPKRR